MTMRYSMPPRARHTRIDDSDCHYGMLDDGSFRQPPAGMHNAAPSLYERRGKSMPRDIIPASKAYFLN